MVMDNLTFCSIERLFRFLINHICHTHLPSANGKLQAHSTSSSFFGSDAKNRRELMMMMIIIMMMTYLCYLMQLLSCFRTIRMFCISECFCYLLLLITSSVVHNNNCYSISDCCHCPSHKSLITSPQLIDFLCRNIKAIIRYVWLYQRRHLPLWRSYIEWPGKLASVTFELIKNDRNCSFFWIRCEWHYNR